jgi:hypothetical protein
VFPSYTVNLSLAGVLSFAFSIFFLMLSDRMKEARKK